MYNTPGDFQLPVTGKIKVHVNYTDVPHHCHLNLLKSSEGE